MTPVSDAAYRAELEKIALSFGSFAKPLENVGTSLGNMAKTTGGFVGKKLKTLGSHIEDVSGASHMSEAARMGKPGKSVENTPEAMRKYRDWAYSGDVKQVQNTAKKQNYMLARKRGMTPSTMAGLKSKGSDMADIRFRAEALPKTASKRSKDEELHERAASRAAIGGFLGGPIGAPLGAASGAPHGERANAAWGAGLGSVVGAGTALAGIGAAMRAGLGHEAQLLLIPAGSAIGAAVGTRRVLRKRKEKRASHDLTLQGFLDEMAKIAKKKSKDRNTDARTMNTDELEKIINARSAGLGGHDERYVKSGLVRKGAGALAAIGVGALVGRKLRSALMRGDPYYDELFEKRMGTLQGGLIGFAANRGSAAASHERVETRKKYKIRKSYNFVGGGK